MKRPSRTKAHTRPRRIEAGVFDGSAEPSEESLTPQTDFAFSLFSFNVEEGVLGILLCPMHKGDGRAFVLFCKLGDTTSVLSRPLRSRR